MKKWLILCCILCLLTGCTQKEAKSDIKKTERVVCLQASLSDIWLTVGGKLAGVTQDAIDRGLDIGDAVCIGSTKSPSAEQIMLQKPDFVIYSPDIAGQLEAAKLLEECGIDIYAAKEDTFSEYLENLKYFCDLLQNPKAYEEYGTKVEKEIENIKLKAKEKLAQREKAPLVLFLRAYSSGYKVKAKGHTVCDILDGLGAVNIASIEESLLENLSIERIMQLNPDYIFIVFMGEDEEAARENLDKTLFSSPIWKELSAVKNEKLFYLPRELFHYKPNARWGKAYEYLYKILYE